MTPALLAAILAPLLAAPTYELDLSERSEVRVRSPGDGLDFEQSGTAILAMRARRLLLSLEYTPRVTFSDLAHEPSIDLLHTGEASSELQFHDVRLTLSERAAYGTRSFTSLTPSTYDLVLDQNNVTIVPVATSVDYGLSETTLTLGTPLTRRTNLGVSGGYLVEGGLDDRARRVIPYVYGPRGSVDLQYELAPRDSLTTIVNGESLHADTGSFGPKQRSDVVRGLELWGHMLSPRTTSELAAGAAWVRRDPSPEDPELFAIGFATLRHMFPRTGGQRSDALGRALVDTQVDRLTGLPDYRLTFQLESTWSKDPYGLYAQLARSQSLRSSQVNSLILYSGEVGLRYQWTKPLLLEVGYRAAYQDVDDPTTAAAAAAASGFNWMTFVALQASAEPFRF